MKKSQIKFYLFWFAEGLAVGLTPYCHILATKWRGYEAFGGEFLIFLFPLLILLLQGGKKDE